MRIAPLLSALAVGALVLGGCSASSSPASSSPVSSSPVSSSPVSSSSASSTTASVAPAALTGTLRVDAAASLKKAFDRLAADFEKTNPGVKVSLSYDGSAVLATQLIGGAPVDVFASADAKNMAKVTAAKLIAAKPTEFATNTLQIAVAPGNPKKITGLKDLTAAGLNVDLCAVAQPCGAAAQSALTAAGVTVDAISTEQSVTAVLTKVESGDADAGLVYRTDVLAAGGKVTGVDFAESARAVNHYPIAVLDAAPNKAAAVAFIALVTGAAGRQILAATGFGAPGA